MFASPWELRAFALAVAAFHGGQFQWNEFQNELIASIRTWEATDSAEPWSYYERWLEALETLLAEKGALANDALAERTQTVLAVPRDQDHHHAHREPVAVSPALS
jgi:nitrile hydratase accessory protein